MCLNAYLFVGLYNSLVLYANWLVHDNARFIKQLTFADKLVGDNFLEGNMDSTLMQSSNTGRSSVVPN